MAMSAIPAPTTLCPHCGKTIKMAVPYLNSGKGAPIPGDLSVCLNCAGMCLYNDDLSLRKLTEQETADVQMLWTRLERLRASIHKLHADLAKRGVSLETGEQIQ